jgi:AraC family transcriptional regulator, regulatory protein of adaptative response / DNA-3-methyladenine glycosylase II
MHLDGDACYRALTARDERFDGVFFVGVTTTGIYCRPICSAKTPGRQRCAFFACAAAAEREGYRACFRCRPELSPGSAPLDARQRLVRATVARIEEGAPGDASLEDLARALGVSSRHLRRSFVAELGVTPVGLLQSRRLALAKQLLHDTSLPIATVAFASGFSSVRRLNAVFQARFGRPPSSLRREREGPTVAPRAGRAATGALTLRLDYRPPLDWEAMLSFLATHATPGVERVLGAAYHRTLRVGDAVGIITVSRDPNRAALRAEVSASLTGGLLPLVGKLRALFDLDAHPRAIADHLAQDPALAEAIARRPGLRVPGALDAFEVAARTVLGQQVSVRGATTLSGRFAARFGEPCVTPWTGVDRLFPTAAAIARLDPGEVAKVGLPQARARALVGIARALDEGVVQLRRGADPDAVIAELTQLEGIGDWTASYLAMRAVGSPDALPAGDLALRKALLVSNARAVVARAAAWRPFRAYAVMHLWQGYMERSA